MRFYKIALLKAYFEKGYGLTSYPKYVVILLGFDQVLNKGSTKWVIIGGLIGFIFCFLLGWWCFKSNFVNAELEVSNQYNPLAKEIREKLIKKKSV